jgi:lysophospholipase L1-like esterase
LVDPACATEICDNSLDDDANGLIDCYDPACCDFSACLIQNTQIITPLSYIVAANLNVGDEYYIDRTYTLTSIPSEIDTRTDEWIMTGNNDKGSTSDTFLEFEIEQDSIVYIGYDSRSTSLPDWLVNDFNPTSLTIGVSEAMDHFNVYAQVFTAGTFSLGGNRADGSAGAGSMYIVVVVPACPGTVSITSPQEYHLQTSNNLIVQAQSGSLEAGWGIKFVLDIDTAMEQAVFDYFTPYNVTFAGVTTDEHTVDAFIADESGATISENLAHDQKIQVGVGNYLVTIGDSITEGVGDDDPSDDISLDGRNFGGGFEPILNDTLTGFASVPYTVENEGVGGDTSADGVSTIQAILNAHPEAQRVLVMYGTNDARPWLPVPSGKGLNDGSAGYPGSYKANIQQIIDAINGDSKEVCLAKVPIALGDSTSSTPYPDPDSGARSVLIKEYNDVIDELVSNPLNNIIVSPPDFYNYFKNVDPSTNRPRYEDQYIDNLHPNGEGYKSMELLWFQSLTQ